MKLYVCLRLCPSGELTSGASPTHSPGWIWSQILLPPPPPQHPGQWPPGPSGGAAVAPLSLKRPSLPLPCQQAWWSPVEQNPLISSPWPDPTFSWAHLVGLPPCSGPAEKLPNNRALLSGSAEPASGATSIRSLAKACKAGKVQQILGHLLPTHGTYMTTYRRSPGSWPPPSSHSRSFPVSPQVKGGTRNWRGQPVALQECAQPPGLAPRAPSRRGMYQRLGIFSKREGQQQGGDLVFTSLGATHYKAYLSLQKARTDYVKGTSFLLPPL